jgi:O-antigen ligase
MAGASRGGLLGLLVFALVAMLLRRKHGVVVIGVSLTVALLVGVSVAYRGGVINSDTPFVRVFGLLDRKIARETDGVSNMHWRMMRWRLARDDIRRSPWFGQGYGGVANYFSMSVAIHHNPEQAKAEKDVAMGQTHNGYISAARGLGIPFAVAFTLILMRQAFVHIRRVRNLPVSDRDRGLHILVASLLVMDLQLLLTNMEFNSEAVWLHLGASVLLERFAAQESGDSRHPLPGEEVAARGGGAQAEAVITDGGLSNSLS